MIPTVGPDRRHFGRWVLEIASAFFAKVRPVQVRVFAFITIHGSDFWFNPY